MPPLKSRDQFQYAFAEMTADQVRRYRPELRDLLTNEFIAGFISSLLVDYEWQTRRFVSEILWTDLTMFLRNGDAGHTRSEAVRLLFGDELRASILETGRRLATGLFEAKKEIPDPVRDCDRYAEIGVQVSKAHVNKTIEAVRSYQSDLREFAVPELLGAITSALIALDFEAATGSPGLHQDVSGPPSQEHQDSEPFASVGL